MDEKMGRFDEIPSQYNPDVKQHDFRRLELGGTTKGWKMQTRKRRQEELQQLDMERPTQEDMMNPKKKMKTSSTIGKKSGRAWKNPSTQRTSAQVKSSQKSTWDEKMKKKRELEAWRRMRREMKEEVKELEKAERKRRADKRKLKEENQKKTGLVMQKISNPKTLKKMSKKQFKKTILTTADVK